MKSIGIIANPNSGKDVRRLYSYALTIGNNEKANLIERIILGAQDLGVEEVFIMPDHYNMGNSIRATLNDNGDLKATINVLDFRPSGNGEDTILAAKIFEEIGVDCIIVLGGDGTSRLVGSTKPSAPIIAVSTGTNNVYPSFYEGTIVGMAAAVVCAYGLKDEYIRRDKIIEVYKNGEVVDYALIDAAITNQLFIGNRAIEKIDDIDELIVSRSHPASIGFSSTIGVQAISTISDDFGYRAKFKQGNVLTLAPFTPGKMTRVKMEEPVKMPLNQMYVCKPQMQGSIALDGERALKFNRNEVVGLVIRRKGPLSVNVEAALEYGVGKQLFRYNG
ncbi:ATP-NAD kinase [Alkalibaculum sp. M08DMB]|uniref:ATP-NAD kinase n=1 Tax=Alkalibaculum sporogenes TaxID=2655001 RepID=A0A6A7K625_9FIRM|nr:ATP-NAD kinase [Alkalibaculum sporogenes]